LAAFAGAETTLMKDSLCRAMMRRQAVWKQWHSSDQEDE
jgi:hypothetical protein